MLSLCCFAAHSRHFPLFKSCSKLTLGGDPRPTRRRFLAGEGLRVLRHAEFSQTPENSLSLSDLPSILMHHDYMNRNAQTQLSKALKSDNILRQKGPFNNIFKHSVAEIPHCCKKAKILFRWRAIKGYVRQYFVISVPISLLKSARADNMESRYKTRPCWMVCRWRGWKEAPEYVDPPWGFLWLEGAGCAGAPRTSRRREGAGCLSSRRLLRPESRFQVSPTQGHNYDDFGNRSSLPVSMHNFKSASQATSKKSSAENCGKL